MFIKKFSMKNLKEEAAADARHESEADQLVVQIPRTISES